MVAYLERIPDSILEELLKHGADVNAITLTGETALHELAMAGLVEDLEFLLQMGAEVNAATNTGETALHWAAIGGHVEAVKLLLTYKADINMRTMDGETALSWAMRDDAHKHREVVDLLLRHTAPAAEATTNGKQILTGPQGVQKDATGRRKWALLIGINTISEPTQSHGSTFSQLQGCVNDVSLTEAYLKEAGLEEVNIKKLITNEGLLDTLPTYKNIIHELVCLTQSAAAGDLVYIHYSGHSTAQPTAFPALKGPDGVDGTLVPMDVHCGGQYLRDLELAYHLNNMVEKGLLVTVVLDCSSPFDIHTKKIMPRGNDAVQSTPISFDAVMEQIAAWSEIRFGDIGRLSLGEFLELPGCSVIIAASGADGYKVYEKEIEGTGKCGVFTYTLLQEVRKARAASLPQTTFKRRVRAAIKAKGCAMPVLPGESNDSGCFFEYL